MTLYKNVNGERIALSTEEETEHAAFTAAKNAEIAANQYKVNRTSSGSTTYDSFGNQLDMLYADMLAGKLDTTGTWATHIKNVKDSNPKP